MRDELNGGTLDFRTWSRQRVDEKFLDDMRYLCNRPLPATTFTALKNCQQHRSGFNNECPRRDSNPRYSLERAVTWAASRWGPASESRDEWV